MSGEFAATFESFRRRGVRRCVAIIVAAGSSSSMLGACSDQSVATPSQTSGTNAGGAAGASVNVAGTASGGGSTASGGGSTASVGGGLPGDGGRSSVGGSSVGGAAAGGTSNAMGGAAGSGGNKPGCPVSFAEAFPYPVSGPTPLCTEQGLTCELPIACSSGAQLLTVTCKNHRWEVGAVGCTKPYDFCPGVAGANGSIVPGVYCKDKKWLVVDTRGQSSQPKPCPAQAPAEALACDQGGGDTLVYDHCGYPCTNDPTKWTVFACANPPNYLGHIAWFSDGACN